MNQVILVGNLVDDVDLRKIPNGKTVCQFRLATTEGFGDKKITEYHDVTAWEKLADNMSLYCSKGSKVGVVGKLRTQSWEKDGQKHNKKYVLADSIEFLSVKPKEPPVQQTLTGDGRDMLGHMEPQKKPVINPDELPFY